MNCHDRLPWFADGGNERWYTVPLTENGVIRIIRRLTSSAQVTDTFLIAQAAALGARLATFDRRITSVALPDAEHVIYQIP